MANIKSLYRFMNIFKYTYKYIYNFEKYYYLNQVLNFLNLPFHLFLVYLIKLLFFNLTLLKI
jgi:hypothetical protein